MEKNHRKDAEKLSVKLAEAIQQIQEHFSLTNIDAADPAKVLAILNSKKDKENITFVSGTGKRKSMLQKSIENLEQLVARQNIKNKKNIALIIACRKT